MPATHALGTRMLSVMEVGAILGLSEETVRRFIRHSELRSTRFGRRVLVHPDDLHEFIESRRTRTCA